MRKWIGVGLSLALCCGAVHIPPACLAALIPVTSYDMPNGQIATNGHGLFFEGFDDTYNGSGDPTIALDPLSGGVGELTDGIIPTDRAGLFLNDGPNPYVGWRIDPTITFNFGGPVTVTSMLIYFSDDDFVIDMPTGLTIGVTGSIDPPLSFPISDPAGQGIRLLAFDNLNLTGSSVDVTITGLSPVTASAMSEVIFDDAVIPEPGSLWLVGFVLLAAILWYFRWSLHRARTAVLQSSR